MQGPATSYRNVLPMPIRFACPECAQLLGVSARKAGAQVKCPKCSASVTVPAAREPETSEAMRPFEQPDVEHAISSLIVFDRSGDRSASNRNRNDDAKRRDTKDLATLLVSRRVVYFQAGLLGAVALLFFLAGWWIGASVNAPADSLPATEGPATLEAHLQYHSSAGDIRPEAGAVVLVLPVARRPSTKLPGTEMVPESPAPNAASPAIIQLGAFGGAYGRADASGKVAPLVLAHSGPHHVLLLSKHTRRSGEPQPQDLATLGSYLEGAADLLGDRQYRLTTEELSGKVEIEYKFGNM